jgi:hypothetical protein
MPEVGRSPVGYARKGGQTVPIASSSDERVAPRRRAHSFHAGGGHLAGLRSDERLSSWIGTANRGCFRLALALTYFAGKNVPLIGLSLQKETRPVLPLGF